MRRGEVWWADLPQPAGRRPVLLLSRDQAYSVRNAVTVAAITRTVRGIAVEVKLVPSDGMPKECVVNLDEILTIPKHLLASRVCRLEEARLQAVERAIHFALDLRS